MNGSHNSAAPVAVQGWMMAAAGVAGAALQLQQTDLWLLADYVTLGVLEFASLLLLYGVARRAGPQGKRAWVRMVVCAVALGLFALLGFAWTGGRAAWFDQQRLDPALEGRDVQIIGVISEMTHSNAMGLRFRMALESATLNGQAVQLPPRMDLGWYRGMAPRSAPSDQSDWDLQRQPQTLVPGERWQMTVRVKAPHGSLNFQGFDYELWLWEQGVQATGYVRAGMRDMPPQRMQSSWHFAIERWRQRVRDRIFLAVPDPVQSALLAALVVGDQSALEQPQWALFRATGVAHLVSISGLHITMFAWAARGLIAWCWRRSSTLCLWWPAPSAAWVGGLAVACAYALFSGWGIPAQRTCIMLAWAALLRLAGARWPWPYVWIVAVLLVVIYDPWSLLQAGFWLSFVAVAVLFATDERACTHYDVASGSAALWRARAMTALRGVYGMGREQFTITLALAPLCIVLFGQLSLVGLLANLLAVPWVTLWITPLALAGVWFEPFWPWAAQSAAWWMLTVQTMAAWPGAVLALPVPPWWLALPAGLGACLLAMPLPWALRWLGLPLLLALGVWRPATPPPGQFTLTAIDIGQGNAVVIRTRNHALLYDAGPRYSLDSDAGQRVIVPMLQAGLIGLDRVMLSHRDTDHVGGAASVFAMQPQADLWSSLETDHALLQGRISTRCQAGQSWQWDGVRFSVLHPDPQAYGAQGAPKPNAMSCVLRVQAVDIHPATDQAMQLVDAATETPASEAAHPEGAFMKSTLTKSALLVGDIEQAQEAQLLARAAAKDRDATLQSDLLLVPHHGSKTSSSAAFLAAVHPQTAVVQAAYRNRYGHPAPPVVRRYEELSQSYAPGAPLQWVDTPHCGAFIWDSWQPEKSQCARQSLRRYWHHRVP